MLQADTMSVNPSIRSWTFLYQIHAKNSSSDSCPLLRMIDIVDTFFRVSGYLCLLIAIIRILNGRKPVGNATEQ